jgi:hypothetical protein
VNYHAGAMPSILLGSARASALALVVVRRATQPTTKLSTWAIVAVALAVALIVVCLAWGAARWWAYEPRWMVSLRHCVAEASYHLSGVWEELTDWVRLGR